MDTVTLPKREYKKLLEASKLVSLKFRLPTNNGKKKKFMDAAFGILKKSFGKRSTIFYVSKLRKAWRA